jgi:hypothetical protein
MIYFNKGVIDMVELLLAMFIAFVLMKLIFRKTKWDGSLIGLWLFVFTYLIYLVIERL